MKILPVSEPGFRQAVCPSAFPSWIEASCVRLESHSSDATWFGPASSQWLQPSSLSASRFPLDFGKLALPVSLGTARHAPGASVPHCAWNGQAAEAQLRQHAPGMDAVFQVAESTTIDAASGRASTRFAAPPVTTCTMPPPVEK